jgi:hypothetical protein
MMMDEVNAGPLIIKALTHFMARQGFLLSDILKLKTVHPETIRARSAF